MTGIAFFKLSTFLLILLAKEKVAKFHGDSVHHAQVQVDRSEALAAPLQALVGQEAQDGLRTPLSLPFTPCSLPGQSRGSLWTQGTP